MIWPVPKYRLVPALVLVLYLVLPREVSLLLMTLWMMAVAAWEFLRQRRPEVGAWSLRHEIPDDFFWMMLGVWLMLVVFSGQRILMVALGFVALGDPMATYVGQHWGKRRWSVHVQKTYEGSAGFFLVCVLWSLFFVKPVVAVLSSAIAAWIESHPWPRPWRTVFILPCLGALLLSVLNMVLGR